LAPSGGCGHVWDRGKLWIAFVFVPSISTKSIGCDVFSQDMPSRGIFLVAQFFCDWWQLKDLCKTIVRFFEHDIRHMK
jgi:hypothetical protein